MAIELLKVLHVISDTNLGGAGRYLLTFLEHYDRSRLHVQVLCPPGSRLIELCQGLGVPVWVSPYLAGDRSFDQRSLLPLLRETRRLLRQQRIDVVHTHASFAGRLAARLTGVPAIVYTRHRLDWEAPRRGIRKWVYLLLNRFTSRRVIAISEAVREALVAEGIPRGRISLIYNGIDVEQFRRQAAQSDCRSRLAAPSQKVVGVVGRLEPEKGHRYFLEAAVSILKEVPEAVFLIVGDGSLAGELKEMARRLGITEQVLVFTGYREDIPQLTAAMDVVVVPSLSEAFGFTLIEGMCLGKPCVASAVGGMREIAEDGRTALLVPPADAPAIAEKVIYLLQHPEYAAALGQAAAEEVERRFSARTMVDQITDLYYQIVEPPD